MDNRFEKLNNSIMFNLSLSSKELFHSNFLGYLFSFNNTLFGKIVNIKDLTVKDVKREFNNIDIEITDNNGKKYLIENKVKDIIDCPQLDKIQNKNKNHEKYYLFSLLGDNLEKLDKKYPLWEEIGYEHIISILKDYNFNNETINIIKNDYCVFMLDLISLFQQDYLKCDRYMLFWEGNNLLEQYKKIRLHDIFQKYGTSHFVNYFRKKYPNTEIKSTYGYNRNGNMTFSKEINNGEYYIEIQIENGEYRKSIVGKKESINELRVMFESIGWFDKNWKSPSNRSYLIFNHNDGMERLYQKSITVNNMSYNDLSEKIKKDFDVVIQKINRL